jgi:probable rRNA maturation factor
MTQRSDNYTKRRPLQIGVTWRLRRSWRAEPLLRRVARFVAAAEGFRTGQLSIAVVGAQAMSTMHERYLNTAGPTDVLTFDLGCDRRRGRLDAEIVVCADVARRNAKARDIASSRRELALYLVHGVLHLAGYDDHSASAFKRMHAREDELLVGLGLGRVFAGG